MAAQSKRFKKLKQKILIYNPGADIELLEKAYTFSKKRLLKKKHIVTGKPLFSQTLENMEILTELKVDSITLAASMLYYNVIYGNTTFEELKSGFGEQVADLLKELREFKSHELKIRESSDEHKLLMAAAKNPRVILIRLANRLSYMRYLDNLSKDKQVTYAKQTLETRAPIAYKLGIHWMKSELEDLCLKYIDPKAYTDIKERIKKKDRRKEIDDLKETLNKQLKEAGTPATVEGRQKHIFSIYKKMQSKQKPVDEIYDITALRIITDTKKRCYEILGLVHALWKPIPEEFDDYIAKPKPNGYQSIHTSLLGPDNKIFEIQIRTKEMNRIAKQGIAAHWKYKGVRSDKKYDKKLSWVRQMMTWREGLTKEKAFMDSLKTDFFEEEIFVFTPKNQIIVLPQGASALDFAYAVHTKIGLTCEKAKVNGKLVALGHELKSGDTVEVITSPKQVPKRSWLNLVKTSKAKQKIRRILQITTQKKSQEKDKDKRRHAREKIIIGPDDPGIKLARCCLPVPGDPVIGYYTTKRKTIVHRKDCLNAMKQKNSRRLVSLVWRAKSKEKYAAEIRVEAKERASLLPDLLKIINRAKIDLTSTNAKTLGKDKYRAIFTVATKNSEQLTKLIEQLERVDSVTGVERN
jgi:GTP pyrophosphokinase